MNRQLKLNLLRYQKKIFCKKISLFLESKKENKAFLQIKKKIYLQDGKIGKKGQLTGDLSLKSVARFQNGYANILEDGINIWFSDHSDNSSGKLKLGDYVFVGFGTYFGLHESITIGNNVLIAAQTYIASVTHNYESKKTLIQQQGVKKAPVNIGNDVWIGCKSVIMPGVSIGDGAVVGAGSVVTKNIPVYEVWCGVPARKIKARS